MVFDGMDGPPRPIAVRRSPRCTSVRRAGTPARPEIDPPNTIPDRGLERTWPRSRPRMQAAPRNYVSSTDRLSPGSSPGASSPVDRCPPADRAAWARKNSRWGAQDTGIAPASMSYASPPVTARRPDAHVILHPAWPETRHPRGARSPVRRPGHVRRRAPVRTLWATCTRLSIFVPGADHRVVMLPRSMVVFAPISRHPRQRYVKSAGSCGSRAVCPGGPNPSLPGRAPRAR
jgi:hypothetical protein